MMKSFYSFILLIFYIIVMVHNIVPHHHHFDNYLLSKENISQYTQRINNLNKKAHHHHDDHSHNHNHSHDNEKDSDSHEHNFPWHSHTITEADTEYIRFTNNNTNTNFESSFFIIKSKLDALIIKSEIEELRKIFEPPFHIDFAFYPGAKALRAPPVFA